ncbi:diguanylate cyclase [Sphingopyxis fribergensis]|uniref:diguanylate cyclase n=1 Tax=Sphingopyxis fribergensis TaxID=1515612 RepID=A0A0A7PMI2_9SPHN|nr:GGDEF domain-containing protein [Sphingopyxis fribergensis]AJA11210.1 diguanylate cyclase [Sphingopyxis fribergensis]
MSTFNRLGADLKHLPASPAGALATFWIAIFTACLFGILTRPVGFLATVWPANAVMLGLMLRMPRTASSGGWLTGACAFMLADLLTGSTLLKTLILNTANLLGIAGAYLIFTRLPSDMRRLRHPNAMLYLVMASAVAGAIAGLVGGIANPVLFGRGVLNGWSFWFATEFANYVLLLPAILVAPPLSSLLSNGWSLRPSGKPVRTLPFVFFILSGAAAVLIGGPGAIAFPVPALLWCSLAYPIFMTSLLTLVFGIWTLGIISGGYIPGPLQAESEMALVSVRLGAALIALAPVMLASVMQNRKELLDRMRHLAMHDPLTGVANRNAFIENSERMLREIDQSVAIMMVDLDQFKSINDRFGHAAGDQVLTTFADRARDCLRPQDILGRMGGEEFAIMIAGCSQKEAMMVAERIRSVASEPIMLDEHQPLVATVSIGLIIVSPAVGGPIDPLLSAADRLLYLAKQNGRDRVESLVKPALLDTSP